MRLPTDHPQRYALNNEIHARAPQDVEAPSQISYLVLTFSAAEKNQAHGDLARLCEMAGAATPPPDVLHFRSSFGQINLNWERHTEFATFTFTRHTSFAHPFKNTVLEAVPEQWLLSVHGELLIGIHLAVRDHSDHVPDLLKVVPDFSGNYLVGSSVGSNTAIVLTDFRIHEDGCSRILLVDTKMGKRHAGRTVRRLLEIETYRMACLLGLPVAREVGQTVAKAEAELAAHTTSLTSSLTERRGDDEAALLKQLTALAATVENQLATTNFRFGAARAYYALVKRRIAELREERLTGVQTIEEFMERRLAPAMETCESAAKRLFDLSERISRASALLRTRVDIEREQQNQALLASMNRRAQMQLRLQQTVEGLSIAAITYYVIGLVGFMAKGLKAIGLPIDADIAMAVAIPFVAGTAWFALQRWRAKVKASKSSTEFLDD